MIITRNWIQEYINISEISTENICKTLNSIGLEVENLNKQRIAKGVVVGKVLKKERHTNSNKLNICQVDIKKKIVQIVCAAKNVNEGQYVPVATVGCKLSEDFEIKEVKLRDIQSNGMICSASEIGLAKLNDGVLELDMSIGELEIGKELSKYPLLNDDIIEIELTTNRGDCLSINGVARELSAFYNIPFIEQDYPIINNKLGIGQTLEIRSVNEIHSTFIYALAQTKNFSLPLLHKLRLAIINRYKTNDLSNALSYSTHATGVILNSYAKKDAKTVKNLAAIEIKKDAQGFDIVSGLKTLSVVGIEHQDINIDVNDEYIIEASYINPELISKKVFETKRKTTEVYYRSSRGSEPCIEFAINYFCSLISKYGAKIYNGNESFIDYTEKITLDVDVDKINSIIGQMVKKVTIEKILSSLGFEVKDGLNGVLSIKVPMFRHDIKNIADITEEIVRIIGIDNIKAKPLAIDEVNRNNETSSNLTKKNNLRARAIGNQFYETLTYIFTSKEKLTKYNLPFVKDSLNILNPIAKEFDTFRTTILLNLIEACSNNLKQGFKSISFFEIGKVFSTNREESIKIAFIFSGQKEFETISNSGKPENIDFFEFTKKILNTIGKFDLKPIEKITNNLVHPYQNANIFIDGKEAGFISKLHPSVADDYDLSDTFIAEINFDTIKDDLVKIESYSKFQSSKKDLSIVVPKDLEYEKIKKTINSIKDKTIKQFNLIDIYSDEKLQKNASESITIRFILQSDEKTLQEEDINSTMNKIIKTLNERLNISLRN